MKNIQEHREFNCEKCGKLVVLLNYTGNFNDCKLYWTLESQSSWPSLDGHAPVKYHLCRECGFELEKTFQK